jgi:hypothetical protein
MHHSLQQLSSRSHCIGSRQHLPFRARPMPSLRANSERRSAQTRLGRSIIAASACRLTRQSARRLAPHRTAYRFGTASHRRAGRQIRRCAADQRRRCPPSARTENAQPSCDHRRRQSITRAPINSPLRRAVPIATQSREASGGQCLSLCRHADQAHGAQGRYGCAVCRGSSRPVRKRLSGCALAAQCENRER